MALAGMTTTASAATMRFLTGAAVASGSTISGSTKASTNSAFSAGAGGSITCASSTLSGTLGTNPATPSVSGSLTSLTFNGCTDTIPFVTLSTVATNVGAGANAKPMTMTYLGAASTLAISGLAWTVTFTDGRTCIYAPTTDPATAQHNSHSSPWNAEYTFNVPLTRTGGTSFACPSVNVVWSATYVLSVGTIQP